jgi:hypothetical protein
MTKTKLRSKTEPTDKLVVMRMIRDDPLGAMHAHGTIDDTEFWAGRKWQACYEKVTLGRLPTFLDASKALKAASKALGKAGDTMIHDILGKGFSIRQVAKMRACNNKVGRAGLERLFHRYMEKLIAA